jgi:hypothetical protein
MPDYRMDGGALPCIGPEMSFRSGAAYCQLAAITGVSTS